MKCQNCGAASEGAITFCGYCGSAAALSAVGPMPAIAMPSPQAMADEPPPLPTSHKPVTLPPPWGPRFALIERAGGVKLPKIRELSFWDRAGLTFNGWAFFFGIFYYLSKGMGKRGLMIFLVSIAAMSVMGAIGGSMAKLASFVMPVLFALRANTDYYKKVVLKDEGWW